MNFKTIITAPWPELASGWDFFGIGIFYFWPDRKIPQSRGSGFENPEKTQNPGDRNRDFKSSKNPEKSRVQNPENPEKIPKEKSRKSRNLGDRNRDLKISTEKSRKSQNVLDWNFRKTFRLIPENAYIERISIGYNFRCDQNDTLTTQKTATQSGDAGSWQVACTLS